MPSAKTLKLLFAHNHVYSTTHAIVMGEQLTALGLKCQRADRFDRGNVSKGGKVLSRVAKGGKGWQTDKE